MNEKSKAKEAYCLMQYRQMDFIAQIAGSGSMASKTIPPPSGDMALIDRLKGALYNIFVRSLGRGLRLGSAPPPQGGQAGQVSLELSRS